MTTYNATATREGNWWVLDVDDVGVTQCARLTEAHAQIRGLIEAVEDRDVPTDTVIHISLDGPVDDALREAREAAEVAETLRDLAARRLRNIAHHLVNEQGLNQSEAAVVLEVSKQRVTQLLARTEPKNIRTDVVHMEVDSPLYRAACNLFENRWLERQAVRPVVSTEHAKSDA